MDLRGKPYQEQGKTVCPVVRSDSNTRVCRIDKWLSRYGAKFHSEQNPAYGHRPLTVYDFPLILSEVEGRASPLAEHIKDKKMPTFPVHPEAELRKKRRIEG